MTREQISQTNPEFPTVVGEPGDVAALAQKVLNVATSIRSVEKSGRNNFHKYDYVTENDLLESVVPGLESEGVMVFTNTTQQTVLATETKKGDPEFLTLVTTAHVFIDGETGAQITIHSQGQGTDAGDKGVYKAITGANKYFLYKSFLRAAGDDPEKDSGKSRSNRSTKRSRNGRSRKRRSAPSQSFINEADVKRLFKTAAKKFDLNATEVRSILSEKGISSARKIPQSKASDVVGWLKEATEKKGSESAEGAEESAEE